MIHSLAGGTIRDGGMHTFVLVQIVGTDEKKWYLSDGWRTNVGDEVYVTLNGKSETAVVVRVDKASGQSGPMPLGRLVQIDGKAIK